MSITVDINVLSLRTIDGPPMLVTTIDSGAHDPDTIREIAEQMRAQIGPEFRVIVIDSLTLEPASADMAMTLLRTLVESYDNEPVALFSAQFDVARQFVHAVDAPRLPQ